MHINKRESTRVGNVGVHANPITPPHLRVPENANCVVVVGEATGMVDLCNEAIGNRAAGNDCIDKVLNRFDGNKSNANPFALHLVPKH